MDRKSFIVLIVSLAVVMLWFPVWDHFFPRPVPDPSSAGLSISDGTNGSRPAPSGAPAAALNQAPENIRRAVHTGRESFLTITNNQSIYTFTSFGGGLRLIELDRFPNTVGFDRKQAVGAEPFATLNTHSSLPAFAVSAGEQIEADADYTLTRLKNGVRAEKQFPNGLRVVKEFEFGTNYQLVANIRLENSAAAPLKLARQELVMGTASLMTFQDNPLLMGMFWYNGSKAEHIVQSYFDNRTLGCVPGTPRSTYSAGESNVVWAAVHNQFFALAAIPAAPAPAILARRVYLDWEPSELPAEIVKIPPATGIQTAFAYPAETLKPGQSIDRQYKIYAGPKEYNTLARLGLGQKNDLDLIMDFGFFGFASKALLLSMNGLNALGLSYGLAIICITVIIKLLFWPLTHASTRSMKRMQALQPQMKALQEKYKADPVKMNQKLMEFMKENKVSPLGGCLPGFLQIPVFIGFYRMLQSAIELRGARFLWAADLSQPDTIAHIGFLGNFPLNPLPVLMVCTQLWQARLTPPSPGVDPAQQKMMRYMPLMFILFFYKTSAGLTLYWAVQNLLTIVQMKLTKATDPVPAAGPAALAARKKK